MLFIFSTPVLIRHLWQLKTVFFLHWCLIRTVLLSSDDRNMSIHPSCFHKAQGCRVSTVLATVARVLADNNAKNNANVNGALRLIYTSNFKVLFRIKLVRFANIKKPTSLLRNRAACKRYFSRCILCLCLKVGVTLGGGGAKVLKI